MDEIRARYDGECVLLEDPEADEHLRILRGKVVCHSRDRDDVYRRAADLRLEHMAFLYAGEVPADAVYVL